MPGLCNKVAAVMLDPCPFPGLVYYSQQSIPMSLIFKLLLGFTPFFFLWKLNIFKQKHAETFRKLMNKERKIFGVFSVLLVVVVGCLVGRLVFSPQNGDIRNFGTKSR